MRYRSIIKKRTFDSPDPKQQLLFGGPLENRQWASLGVEHPFLQVNRVAIHEREVEVFEPESPVPHQSHSTPLEG
jgi:hypothetical protein